MALGALAHAHELVGPLLPACAVVVVHDALQVFHHAVELDEVVARRVHQLLPYAHVLHRAVEYLAHRLLGDVFHRCVQRASVPVEQGFYLPEYHLVLVFAQGHNRPLADGERRVGNHLHKVDPVDVAQTLAARTCSLGRVERELVGRRVAVRHARRGAHQALAVILRLARVLFHYHQQAVALLHCRGHALPEPLVVLVPHAQLVYHHLYVVVLVAVGLHAARYFNNLAVHSHVQVSLAAHALEQLAVVPLSVAHERGQDVYRLAVVALVYHAQHVVLGVFHHLLARGVAVGRAGPGVEQAEVVVYLGGGAHG